MFLLILYCLLYVLSMLPVVLGLGFVCCAPPLSTPTSSAIEPGIVEQALTYWCVYCIAIVQRSTHMLML